MKKQSVNATYYSFKILLPFIFFSCCLSPISYAQNQHWYLMISNEGTNWRNHTIQRSDEALGLFTVILTPVILNNERCVRHTQTNVILNPIKSLHTCELAWWANLNYTFQITSLLTYDKEHSESSSSDGKFRFVMFLPPRFRGRSLSMFCNQRNKTFTKPSHTPRLARGGGN